MNARNINNPNDAHDETSAVESYVLDANPVIKFAVWLLVGVLISMALMWALMRGWMLLQPAPPRDSSRVGKRTEDRTPPAPQLLSGTGMRVKAEDLTSDPTLQKELSGRDLNYELQHPEAYRQALDQVKERELSSYGTIHHAQPAQGQPADEIRIPINEAKRQLIERLAGQATATATAAPTASPRAANSDALGYDLLPTAASAGRVTERRVQ